MTNEEFIILAEKVAEGSASISEVALYNACYESFQKDAQNLTADGLDSKDLKKESLARFWKNHDSSAPVVKLWPRILVASRRKVGTSLLATAAVAAIVVGVWLYSNKYQDTSIKTGSTASVNDIAPGKNGATITLANGKVIQLSDAKSGVVIGEDDLKYSDGSEVRYSSGTGSSGSLKGSQNSTELQGADGKVQNLIATTARGQTYHFTLADGTKVWLNADSKLEFPSNFVNGKTRNVKLSGEGYFEVAKDKAHPFMVNFRTLTLTVLGTHFNVNAYENEKTAKATLLEGSIKVEKLFLKPAQQAIFDDHRRLSLQTLENAEKETAWKDGYFRFYDEKIQDIMKKLERWYDIEVVYEGKMTTEGFTGKVSRNKNISEVLMILEKTKGVHFKIEGRRVTVID
jgi:ferric-dicitrate binding protein FerR (iron transport regulator)